FLLPIQRHGLAITMKIASYQKGERGAIAAEPILDGHVFTKYTPSDLRDLKLPPRDATPAERAESARKFNRRAAFRRHVHKRPGKDGITKLGCAFHAGRLRSRNLKWTMREERSTAELVTTVPRGASCCDGTEILSVA